MKETTISKVLTLFIKKWVLPLKVHIPVTFSLENCYSDCIVIAKTFLGLSEGTMALIFMAGCSYWLCKAKRNTTPFEVTWQNKMKHSANIPDNTTAGQPGPTFIKPDQLDPWIKDQLGNVLLSTNLPQQLRNFVSHMTHNLVTVGAQLLTGEIICWSLIQGSSWSGLTKIGTRVMYRGCRDVDSNS